MIDDQLKAHILRHSYPEFDLKAVFFDMDGVLFDSMKHHAYAWVEALKSMGLPFSEYDAYMNEGRTGSSTINAVFEKHHSRKATEQEKIDIYRLKTEFFEKRNKSEKIPFSYDLLQIIKEQGIAIFLVTGSGQVSLLDNLEVHFPGFFHKENMITAFDVKDGKPNPEPYLKALAKSGLQPWQVVVVENAPLGVESASKAGLLCLAVNTGPLEEKVLFNNGADIVFPDMKRLYETWPYISDILIKK